MKKSLIILSALMVAFSSCDKIDTGEGDGNGEGNGNGEKAIVVKDKSQLTQTVSAESTEGESVIEFTASGAWTSSVAEAGAAEGKAPEWISVSPDRGDSAGDYTMEISLQPNDSGAERKAVITITCNGEDVKAAFTQRKADSGNEEEGTVTAANPSQLTQTVPAGGTQGASAIEFTTTGAWSSTVLQIPESEVLESPHEDEFWISVSPASGDAAGTYNMELTLQPNESSGDRSAEITITCGKSEIKALVTQQGKGAAQQPSVKLVKRILQQLPGDEENYFTAISFTYDGNNRPVKISTTQKDQESGNDDGGVVIDISWENDKIIATMESQWHGMSEGQVDENGNVIEPGKSEWGRMVQVVNAATDKRGYVQSTEYSSVYYIDSDGSGDVSFKEEGGFSATYTGDLLSALTQEYRDYKKDELTRKRTGNTVCSWTEGNMTGVECENVYYDGQGNKIETKITSTADYNTDLDNNAININLNWLIGESSGYGSMDDTIFEMFGLLGKRSANLLSATRDVYPADGTSHDAKYVYEKDTEGYISTVTVTRNDTSEASRYIISYY